MELGCSYRTIRLFHRRDPFLFPPATLPIKLPQTRELANLPTDGKRLHISDRAADFEEHRRILTSASKCDYHRGFDPDHRVA